MRHQFPTPAAAQNASFVEEVEAAIEGIGGGIGRWLTIAEWQQT
jgi:hypothetical protein